NEPPSDSQVEGKKVEGNDLPTYEESGNDRLLENEHGFDGGDGFYREDAFERTYRENAVDAFDRLYQENELNDRNAFNEVNASPRYSEEMDRGGSAPEGEPENDSERRN